MSLVAHIIFAFLAGTVVEAIYALGVLFIGEMRSLPSGGLAIIWGASFLVGIDEHFHDKTIVGGAWCIGLGVGTVIAIEAKKRWGTKQ